MTKTRLWMVGGILAVAVVLVAGWFLAVSPKRADAGALADQTVVTEGQISSLRTQLKVLEQQKNDLPAKQATLAQLEKRIPADGQMPALIRALDKSAKSAGVDLAVISPGAPQALAPSAAPVAGSKPSVAVAAAPTSTVLVVPLNLTVNGTYFGIEQFISSLEGLQRAFLVQTFGISVASGTAAQAGTTTGTQLQLTVNGQVFVSKSDPTLTATAGATPAPTTTTPAK
jgi:Tfp pilus assembly protein PilO